MKDNNFFWQNAHDILQVADLLKKDQILVTSTDTILGFLGNITEKAFDSINQLKGGRQNKPYLILIDSINKLENFVDVSELSGSTLNLINKCWPGPLTAIFKAKPGLPKYLVSQTNTIAIRLPKHVGLQKTAQHFDGLFSTSANKSNQIPPKTIDEVDKSICNMVAGVVLDKKEKKYQNNIDMSESLDQTLPSSIIDLSNSNQAIIREGAYSIKKMEEYYGAKFKKKG